MPHLRRLFRSLLGEFHWAPPPWLRWCATRPAALNAFRRRSPAPFWGGLGLLLLSAAGAAWYWSLPEPRFVTVEASIPEATALYGDEAGKPRPVILRFSESAAPLDRVGKPVTEGFRVTPELDAAWQWVSDTELSVLPKSDWPVGRLQSVRFEPSFFGPHVRLRSLDVEFRTPAFQAKASDVRFYEDPVDPKIKQVVATIEFSHPVDKQQLERRVAFRMKTDPIEDFDDRRATSLGFQISYDEVGGKAFVRSDVVTIPEREGAMRLTIGAGVSSSLGGTGTESALSEVVTIPGISSYFRIAGVEDRVVTNDRHEMERILAIEATAAMKTEELKSSTEVWLLPKDRPAIGDRPAERDVRWNSEREIVAEVLAASKPVSLDWIASDPEYNPLQTARFHAVAGSQLFVRIRKGLQSFGGFPLAEERTALLTIAEFPAEAKILYEGSLLSLSGEKKLSLLTRNLRSIRIELNRLVPGSVAHLVTQSSPWLPMQKPEFSEWQGLNLDNLAEVFRETRPVPTGVPGAAQYSVFDFTSFVRSDDPPRGLFVLKVIGWNPESDSAVEGVEDQRLVVVTDLGIVAKNLEEGGHTVFVQSIRTGEPIAGARVEVLGKNGMPVLHRETDAAGRVDFPSLSSFTREQSPVAFVAKQSGDYSFLPIGRNDRRVDLTRFDVGGVFAEAEERGLHAYLFSDRGIYRPGEEVHLGILVRRIDWQRLPDGLPFEVAITDPRGIEIRRDPLRFGADGFLEFRMLSEQKALTGSYQAALFVVGEKNVKTFLGSTRFKVEEFEPDRLTLRAALSTPPSAGWIPPEKLRCGFDLKNLFGTPSVGGTVKATLQLSPAQFDFPEYRDYRFYDPATAKKSYDETLAEMTTDASGHADVDLGLERFERSTFRVVVKAEASGPDKGKSVATAVHALVSPLPFLVGWKADGDLGFVRRGSQRKIELIAIDSNLKKVAAEPVNAEWIEITHSSVLTKQPNGTLSYQSVKRETVLRRNALAIDAGGVSQLLPSDRPGSFALVLRDPAGTELNRVAWDVVGDGNVSRSLERTAEVRIKLDRTDYAAGDEIEVAIQSPYPGAGLVTIERDRVYASKWFHSAGNSTVQRITVPNDLEGNGYVVVSFVRALDSKEIFASPLSSGAAPFAVSRGRRTQKVDLTVPEKVQPGETVKVAYRSGRSGKIVVWGVDEGILQVGRYRTPAPLDHFFRKRALEVETMQILDLVLPEHSIAEATAAPGGDDDYLAFGAKNPFKRRGLPPVVFWSGVIETDGGAGEVEYTVPDHFNGTLRVMALAVGPDAIGVGEASTIVRGPFVVQPTIPYAVSPGDEFDASVLIANPGDVKLDDNSIELSIEAGPALEVVGYAKASVEVPEGNETTAHFRVKAREVLGPARLTFVAQAGAAQARSSLELSIRPASPYVTTITSGRIKSGAGQADLPLSRTMYEVDRAVDASASLLPTGLSAGLGRYLRSYPYECTEQLVSRGMAALWERSNAESADARSRADETLQRVFRALIGRQGYGGSFGMFDAASPSHPFIDAWATHLLIESRDRGVSVSESLFSQALAHHEWFVGAESENLPQKRAQAYGLYLLARSGKLVTTEFQGMLARLKEQPDEEWRRDLTAMLMASTASMLQLDVEARDLQKGVSAARGPSEWADYYDDMVHRALVLYLTARHFPDAAKSIPPADLEALSEIVTSGRYHSLSASMLMMAFDQYGAALGEASSGAVRMSAIGQDGLATELPLSGGRFQQSSVPSGAKAVRIAADAARTVFYQLMESGYDVSVATEPMREKIEVLREFRALDGTVLTKVRPLDVVEVHVLVRSLDDGVHEIAMTDLVPGGFELDLSPGGLVDRKSRRDGSDLWSPLHIDVREDRVTFYGSALPTAKRFVYRIKPMSRGVYRVPPLYAEGMYERAVRARSVGGTIEIAE